MYPLYNSQCSVLSRDSGDSYPLVLARFSSFPIGRNESGSVPLAVRLPSRSPWPPATVLSQTHVFVHLLSRVLPEPSAHWHKSIRVLPRWSKSPRKTLLYIASVFPIIAG